MNQVLHITKNHWYEAEIILPVHINRAAIFNKAIEIALAEQEQLENEANESINQLVDSDVLLIPHITIEQATAVMSTMPNLCNAWLLASNMAIDAYNKANEQPLITADEARKLGAGKAEYLSWNGDWVICEENQFKHTSFVTEKPIKYRAIKQPEPVEPHAELKAMYEQQVKDGTLGDFVWEHNDKDESYGWLQTDAPDFTDDLYRCTPKPTCQVRNLDTGELKTMTREKAKLLQDETKDVCDWFDGFGLKAGGLLYAVDASGIYTFKLKAKPWTGSREDVIALLNELGVTK